MNIEDSDVQNGIPGNPTSCALALAVKRTFPKAKKVVVNPSQGTMWIDGKSTTLNPHLVKWMKRFDQGIREPYDGTLLFTASPTSEDKGKQMAAMGKPVCAR